MLSRFAAFFRKLRLPLTVLAVASFGVLLLFASQEIGKQDYNRTAYEYGASLYAFTLGLLLRLGMFIEIHEGGIVAASTVAIAIFTLTLWRATVRLWRAGERQLAVAEGSANAAARAATVAEEGLYKLERPILLAVDKNTQILDWRDDSGETVWCITFGRPPFRLSIANYGKTLAIVNCVAARCFVGPSFPTCPTYTSGVRGFWVVKDGETIGPFTFIADEVTNKEINSVVGGTQMIMAYGVIKYRDVFGRYHMHGFGARLDAKTGDWFEDGGEAYNYDRPDKDPGQST